MPAHPPDESAWDDHILQSARLFNRAQRLFARIVDGRLRELGFRFAQVPVLAALQGEAPLSQKELARIAEVEQASMAQILARMERDGLIQRARDPDDGRSTLVSLTATARAQLPFAREALRHASREAVAGFDEATVRTLTQLLERVIGNLEGAQEARDGIAGAEPEASEDHT